MRSWPAAEQSNSCKSTRSPVYRRKVSSPPSPMRKWMGSSRPCANARGWQRSRFMEGTGKGPKSKIRGLVQGPKSEVQSQRRRSRRLPLKRPWTLDFRPWTDSNANGLGRPREFRAILHPDRLHDITDEGVDLL